MLPAAMAVTASLALLQAYASFDNGKGETFPFTVKVVRAASPVATVMVSHGGSCRTTQEEAWAERFRQWGYNAVIIDHCSVRALKPHTGVEPPPLLPPERVNDAIVLAEWIKVQPWHTGKVALFGISRGGEAVLRASDPRLNRVRRGSEGLAEIDAYVALYPACSVLPRAPRGPLLILHGEEDNLASFKRCEYSSLNHANLTIKTYPGASHTFDVPGDDIVGSNQFLGSYVARRYNASAAAKSFSDTRQFLDTHLKP